MYLQFPLFHNCNRYTFRLTSCHFLCYPPLKPSKELVSIFSLFFFSLFPCNRCKDEWLCMTLVKVGTSYETHGICKGGLTLSDCFPTESTGKWEIYSEGSLGGGTAIENRFSPKVDNGSQPKIMLGEKEKGAYYHESGARPSPPRPEEAWAWERSWGILMAFILLSETG